MPLPIIEELQMLESNAGVYVITVTPFEEYPMIVKIGMSTNIKKRLDNYTTCFPFTEDEGGWDIIALIGLRPEVIDKAKIAREIEKNILGLLNTRRIRNKLRYRAHDWLFLENQEDLDYLYRELDNVAESFEDYAMPMVTEFTEIVYP